MAPISVAVSALIPASDKFLKYPGRAEATPEREGLAAFIVVSAEIDICGTYRLIKEGMGRNPTSVNRHKGQNSLASGTHKPEAASAKTVKFRGIQIALLNSGDCGGN
jgi:hypothetical protein